MSLLIRIRPEAEADLSEAYGWYEDQRTGLGDEFLLCVDACLLGIQRHPESSPVVHREVRRALLKRFPYGVFYLLGEGGISVVGVFHQSRDPRKWTAR
jgi:plasmid stabilization system protein ParE